MQVYLYDKDTKEYLNSEIAVKDPVATERIGKFVPLVPANATLIKPMAALHNQIQVFNTDTQEWTLFNDYRKNFYKVDDCLAVYDIKKIGDIEQGYYLVDKSTGDEIKADIRRYKIENNQVVRKSDEEFAKENFELARAMKYLENNNEAEYARHNQEFSLLIQDKICVFDTNYQTQTDLLTAIAVCSTGSTYDGWITNNGVEINLTLKDINLIYIKFKELSNVYPKWKYFKELIDNAKTQEEVETIVIDYKSEVA